MAQRAPEMQLKKEFIYQRCQFFVLEKTQSHRHLCIWMIYIKFEANKIP